MVDEPFVNPLETRGPTLSAFWTDTLDRVSSVSRALSTIGSRSENDFMALGQSLMEGEAAGRDMASRALGIVSLSQGDQEKAALASMKDLVQQSLDRFRANKEKTGHQIASVRIVLAHLGELQSKNGEIDRMARYLRAVALNIFIETSRSRALSDNFSIIAGEIKQLSENILSLSKTINTTLNEATTRFSTLYTGILQGLNELDQVSSDADQAMGKAITTTDTWLNLAEIAGAAIAENGQQLYGHVGRIVMALQFHDAMRQRLEHMEAGLSDMASLGGPDPEPDRNALALAHALADLMGDHMDHMILDVDHTHTECSQAFDAIERCLESIADDVMRLAGGSAKRFERSDENAGQLLLSSIQRLADLRKRGLVLVERLGDIYAMSFQTTTTLTGLTTQIHSISMDAHIKGLNAIIAASHLGDEGRTLAVLAEEMKRLADLADVFVKDVEAIIGKVGASLGERQTSEDDGDHLDSRLDETLRTIVGMVDSMKSMAGGLHGNLETMGSIHRRVKDQLEVIPAMGRALGERKRELDGVFGSLSPYADSRGRERLAERGIIERYTMEKERMIHSSSLAGSKDPEKGSGGDQAGDFGDNIELF